MFPHACATCSVLPFNISTTKINSVFFVMFPKTEGKVGEILKKLGERFWRGNLEAFSGIFGEFLVVFM